MRLKAERIAEEKRLEDEFKSKLLAKFAEDERLEQMAQQRRRMRELEHRREVERLWQQKLVVYREERAIELDIRAAADAKAANEASIIENEKQRLIAEHAVILKQHHPKAAHQYAC